MILKIIRTQLKNMVQDTSSKIAKMQIDRLPKKNYIFS